MTLRGDEPDEIFIVVEAVHDVDGDRSVAEIVFELSERASVD